MNKNYKLLFSMTCFFVIVILFSIIFGVNKYQKNNIEYFDNKNEVSRLLTFQNNTNDDLVIVYTSKISSNYIPKSLSDSINTNLKNVEINEDAKYIIGIIKKKEILSLLVKLDPTSKGSCNYLKDIGNRTHCFNSINLQLYKNQLFNETDTKPYTGNVQIEFTFEEGEGISDSYDLSAIPDSTCGAHMNKQSINYGKVKSTDCLDCTKGDEKYTYNPKNEGVSDDTYVSSYCNDKIKNNVKVCGLPNTFKDGTKPICKNGIDEKPCTNWEDSTIEKSMNEIWKCVTSVNDEPFKYNIILEAPKNVETFTNENKIKKTLNKIINLETGEINNENNGEIDENKSIECDIDDEFGSACVEKCPSNHYCFLSEDAEGNKTQGCTPDYEDPNVNPIKKGQCFVGKKTNKLNCATSKVLIDTSKKGFEIENYKDWPIYQLLSIKDGQNDPNESDFNSYIYPYNEELFEGPLLTCESEASEYNGKYFNIEDSVENVRKSLEDNEYYYDSEFDNLSKKTTDTKEYIIKIYEFGKTK